MSLLPGLGGRSNPLPEGRQAERSRGRHSRFALVAAYLLALVLPTATVAGRLAADPWLGDQPALILFLLPILIAAFVGGLGPGIVATGFTALATAYFILPPRENFGIERPGHLVSWAALLMIGVVFSVVTEVLHRARAPERSTDARPIEWKVNAGFSVALVVVCAVGAVSYYSIGQMTDSMAAAHRSEQMISTMRTLVSTIRDVEATVGRYVINGDESQLGRLDALAVKVGGEVRELGAHIGERAEYRERYDAVSRLVTRRLEVARAVIALRQSSVVAAQAAVGTGEGKQLVDSLRGVLDDLESAENAVEHEREAQAARHGAVARATITVGIALAFMFMLAAMFVINRDLAGRRRADALLREAKDSLEARVAERTAELAASEAQLRSVTDALPALIAHVGADYRYLYVNQAFADWFGRPREEIVGRTMEEVLGAESVAPAATDLAAALRGATVPFERTSVRHDGEKREIAGVMIPEKDASGRTTGIFVLVNDLTDRRRSEALVQRAESMKSLGTLAGGIAHDFNNILPAIRGFAALAAEELAADHPSREYLERIEKAAERASDLVRRILAFSRPQKSATQRMDLAAAVDDALKLVDAAVPATIKLRVALARGLPEVDADPTEIYQIVLNLLTNAVHAIGANPGVIDVGLERVRGGETRSGPALESRDYLCLVVADSGCGMDAATQARIFDPFFTTKVVGQGTGLGLSILHGIMKKAGGEIAVYSDVGRGTRFSLYFPIPDADSKVEQPGATQVARGQGQRVMYVDDEAPLVFVATYVLKRLGYEVRGFTSAPEALAAFRAHPHDFDAVVTDLSMPDMSGFDFARQVLAVRPDIPVAMASGYVRIEDEARARECGVRRIVSKPSTVQEYAAALDGIFVG